MRLSTSRLAGALTLLIAIAAILTSYAMATGWAPPGLATETHDLAIPTTRVEVTSVTQPATSTPTMPPVADVASGPLGPQDGHLPDGVVLSPWDIDHPAIANLDPDLLKAVQRAATDAKADGIEMVINSGWRSQRYQQSLLDEAVTTYGSEDEARKWVASPDTSAHVTGVGVDIGYTDADYWLIEHGNAYGLCQTYENEIWHFELAVAPGGTCPAPLLDASPTG